MTKEQTEQLKAEGRALLAKATPGEWLLHENGSSIEIVDSSGETSDASDIAYISDQPTKGYVAHMSDKEDWALPGTDIDNARLIVFLKNNAPVLLAEAQENVT